MINIKNKKRFRDYGFVVGFLPTGDLNTIADVEGVRVGHSTKIQGRDTRTGVTVIDPGVKDLFRKKIPGAIAVGNGHGKFAGFTQVEELGTIEAPIALTNTLAVGTVLNAMVKIAISDIKNLRPYETVNAVVGEANDWIINNIHKNSIRESDVLEAYRLLSRNVELGSVGAGTGMRAFSWKGGIGSASRRIKIGKREYLFGALVQTNYGGSLSILGVPVGALLGVKWSATPAEFTQHLSKSSGVRDKTGFSRVRQNIEVSSKGTGFMHDGGSCMIVLATDAPLTARQLKRIASRAFLALGRTGAIMAHASGDYSVAFSTSRDGLEGVRGVCLKDEELNLFFEAAVETVEESVYDALFLAGTIKGRNGNELRALPHEEVVRMLRTFVS